MEKLTIYIGLTIGGIIGGKRNQLLRRQHVLDFQESRERHSLSP